MRKTVAILIALFVADRLIKNITWFSPRLSSDGFLHPVLNPNIAFSLPLPAVTPLYLNALLSIVIVCFAVVVFRQYRTKDPAMFWWGLITIGALSNLMDRFILGGVLDYVDLRWFPIFNMSDAYITVGVSYLLYREIRGHRRVIH